MASINDKCDNNPTMENVKKLYKSDRNIHFISKQNNNINTDQINESVTYYSAKIYGGEREWETKPSKDCMKTGGRSRNNKGSRGAYVYTGFIDCPCGKRIESTCPRRYKLLLKLHFKANPLCKISWEENCV